MASIPRRTCFATVGTTQFDALPAALLSMEVLNMLKKQGYGRLVMQLGRGTEPIIPESAPLEIDWCAEQ
jgi:UDP-N-acetylglucosamine transferase subunit ALG13